MGCTSVEMQPRTTLPKQSARAPMTPNPKRVSTARRPSRRDRFCCLQAQACHMHRQVQECSRRSADSHQRTSWAKHEKDVFTLQIYATTYRAPTPMTPMSYLRRGRRGPDSTGERPRTAEGPPFRTGRPYSMQCKPDHTSLTDAKSTGGCHRRCGENADVALAIP